MKKLLLSSLLLISSYSFATALSPSIGTTVYQIPAYPEDPYVISEFNGKRYSLTKEEYIKAPAYSIKFTTYENDVKKGEEISIAKSEMPSTISAYKTVPYIKSVTVMNDSNSSPIQEDATITDGYSIVYLLKEGVNKNEVSFTIHYAGAFLIGMDKFSVFQNKDLWVDRPKSEIRESKQSGNAILGKELEFMSWTQKKAGIENEVSRMSIKIEINKVD